MHDAREPGGDETRTPFAAGPSTVSNGDAVPYEDSLDHLLDELERLDLRLLAHLEAWWAERGGAPDELRGLYVSDREVEELLRSSHREVNDGPPNEELADRIVALTRRIHRRTRASIDADTGPDLRLELLSDRLGLGPVHVDALLLALAPDLDRKYAKVYAYLQDDVTKGRPTVGLVERILCGPERRRFDVRGALSGSSPLLGGGFVRVVGDERTPFPLHTVAVDRPVVDFLLGDDTLNSVLDGVATLLRPTRGVGDLIVDRGPQAALRGLAEAFRSRRAVGPPDGGPKGSVRPTMVRLHGPDARVEAAAAVCADADAPLVVADVAAMPAVDVPALIDHTVRAARLRGAAVCVENLDGVRDGTEEGSEAAFEGVIRQLDRFDVDVFFVSRAPPSRRTRRAVGNHRLAAIHFPIPSYEIRRTLWEGVDDLPPGAEPAALASAFRFTAEQVRAATAIAAENESGEHDAPSREAVYAGCRRVARPDLGSRAREIEPTYGWDDIVLPADTTAQLREVAARVRHGDRVYDEWGFEGKHSLGNGLVALFSGPSGTGKTMAAEVVAGDAGLALYRIDLSRVVSKYVGETEANLREVFERAEEADAVLLFDEADALFGKRSEVRDARDRYANVEVDYLLQRIEEYDGTAVLTTNLKQNVDDAFRRRIHAIVEFPFPDREARRELWQKIFPPETPVAEVDFKFLSTLELSGGDIKNVALTASFLAAAEGDVVEMRHVVRAARREFQKADRLATAEAFAEYGDLLQE